MLVAGVAVGCTRLCDAAQFRRIFYKYLKKPEEAMYHYDPNTALDELNEDALLPNPVHLRDMILRAHLDADHSLEYNRLFVEYQRRFGEIQELGRQLLEKLRRATKP